MREYCWNPDGLIVSFFSSTLTPRCSCGLYSVRSSHAKPELVEAVPGSNKSSREPRIKSMAGLVTLRTAVSEKSDVKGFEIRVVDHRIL